MNCRTARRHLSPYLDSELDATTTYAISRHLEGCPACAALFDQERKLEQTMRARLRLQEGDEPAVFERALARAVPRRVPRPRRTALVAGVALLLTLATALGLRRLWPAEARTPGLVAMVARDHARYLRGEAPPESHARDAARLAAFFRERGVADLGALPTQAGWQIEGGRVCRFRGSPVPFVTLSYHGLPVSLVEVPHSAEAALDRATLRAAAEGACFEYARGRGIVRNTPTGVRVVFGALETSRLEEVALVTR